jgi:hypothetical protein
MICPNCGNSNQCPCKNCDPDGTKPNKYIWIDIEGTAQCSFCGSKFNEWDSLNYEWDKMVEKICEEISYDMCIEWFETGRRDSSINYELAFKKYFNRTPISISVDEWLQIKRNYKIKKLIQ